MMLTHIAGLWDLKSVFILLWAFWKAEVALASQKISKCRWVRFHCGLLRNCNDVVHQSLWLWHLVCPYLPEMIKLQDFSKLQRYSGTLFGDTVQLCTLSHFHAINQGFCYFWLDSNPIPTRPQLLEQPPPVHAQSWKFLEYSGGRKPPRSPEAVRQWRESSSPSWSWQVRPGSSIPGSLQIEQVEIRCCLMNLEMLSHKNGIQKKLPKEATTNTAKRSQRLV